MPSARTLPIADGSDAYMAAVVIGGSTASTAVFKRAPVARANVLVGQNLPAGNTVLTLALARSGVLYSTAASQTTLFIPTLANITDIGTYVFDANNPNGLVFAVERQGLGLLALNFAAGVTVNWNNLDTATLPQYHGPVMLRMVANNTWVAS